MTGTTNHTVNNAAVKASLMQTLPVRDVKIDSISLPLSPTNNKQWIVTVLSLSQSRGCVVKVELSLFATPSTKVLATFNL